MMSDSSGSVPASAAYLASNVPTESSYGESAETSQQRDSTSSAGDRSSLGGATAIDEVWQNQTYLPIKGWGAPFTSPTHYSDVSGEKRFGDDLPEYPPLEGWMWTTNWTVDTSNSFGSTDADGWAYGSTFDALVEAIQSNKASGTKSATSIVRRRRFIRLRSCVSAEANALLYTRTSALLGIRTRLEAALGEKRTSFARVMQFEKERSQLFYDKKALFSYDIVSAGGVLQNNISRLEDFKQCFIEISEASREYSKRMGGLSVKFGKYATTYGNRKVDQGLYPSNSTTTTSSSTSSSASVGSNSTEGGDVISSDAVNTTGALPVPDNESILSISAEDPEAAIFAFFHNSRIFNSKLATGLGDLASTINGPIGSTINDAIRDLQRTLQSVRSDSHISDDYRVAEEAVVRAVSQLTDGFVLIESADESEILRINKLLSGELVDEDWNAYASVTPLSQSEAGAGIYKMHSNKDGHDMWRLYYNYVEAVSHCTYIFNNFERIAERARREKDMCCRAVCAVIASSYRSFSSEQKSVFKDSLGALLLPYVDFDHTSFASKESETEPRKPSSEVPAAEAEVAPAVAAKADVVVSSLSLPPMPLCSTAVREGNFRFAPGDEARKGIISATNINIKGTGNKGIQWTQARALLTSDGTLHLLTPTAAAVQSAGATTASSDGGSGDSAVQNGPSVDSSALSTSRHPLGEFLTKSFFLKGCDVIVHSSPIGLFPIMLELVAKHSSGNSGGGGSTTSNMLMSGGSISASGAVALLDSVMASASKPRDIFILGSDDAETLSWAQQLTDIFGGAALVSNKKVGGAGNLSIPDKFKANAAGFVNNVAAPMANIIANDVSAAVSRVRSGTVGNRSESSDSGANTSSGMGAFASGSASNDTSTDVRKSHSLDADDGNNHTGNDASGATSPSTASTIDLKNISPALAYASPSRLISTTPTTPMGGSGGSSGSASSSKVERVLQQSDAALLDAVNLANEFRLSEGDDEEDGEGENIIAAVEE